MELLEIRNLNLSFGGLHAVNDVSFSVCRNKIKAVIGPNGAGKTTLFNLISGMLKPDSGSIYFMERPIHQLPSFRIASGGISRTFQNIKLFSNMTVLENVKVGMHVKTGSGFFSGMLKLPSALKEEKIIEQKSMELLKNLGLGDLVYQNAGNLAFGKQRIVEFARALSSEPDLIMLDEPAAGLNIYETAELSDIISGIREKGVTVLIIEHDMSLIMDISDEIVVLSSGSKIAEGMPRDIQSNPEVINIYLGDEDA